MFTLKMFTLKLCSALGGSVKGDLSWLRERETVWDYCNDNEGSSHLKGMKYQKWEILRPLEKDYWLLKGDI